MTERLQPRSVPIAELAPLLRAIREVRPEGKTGTTAATPWPVEVVCTQCGIRLNQDEMGALATGSAPSGPRLERLSQGYCARKDCPASYYRVELPEGIEWNRVFAATEPAAVGAIDTPPESNAGSMAMLIAGRRPLIWRVSIGVGIVLLLLLIRQWYIGGTIPLIREPETFQVDPTSLPPEFTTNRNPAGPTP